MLVFIWIFILPLINSSTYQWHAANKYDKQHEGIKIAVFHDTQNFGTGGKNSPVYRWLVTLLAIPLATKYWQTIRHMMVLMVPNGLLRMLRWRSTSTTCRRPWNRLARNFSGSAFRVNDVVGSTRGLEILVCVFWVGPPRARFRGRAKRTHYVQILSRNATKSSSDVPRPFCLRFVQRFCREGIEEESEEEIQYLEKIIKVY